MTLRVLLVLALVAGVACTPELDARLKHLEEQNAALRKQLPKAGDSARFAEAKGSKGIEDALKTAAKAGAGDFAKNGDAVDAGKAALANLLGGTQPAAAPQNPAAAPQNPVMATPMPVAEANAAQMPEVQEMIPFGKHVPQEPGKKYILASGNQECMVCQTIISEAYLMGVNFFDLCSYNIRGTNTNTAMCKAQERVLKSCPEFTNDWCYQDLGGTQVLRAPCPSYLKCHYCLGLNPLHCIAQPYGMYEGMFT